MVIVYSFLDTAVHRKDNKFVTSVYRKPTFTGLGMSYFSYCCDIYLKSMPSRLFFLELIISALIIL